MWVPKGWTFTGMLSSREIKRLARLIKLRYIPLLRGKYTTRDPTKSCYGFHRVYFVVGKHGDEICATIIARALAKALIEEEHARIADLPLLSQWA